ncbi:MAG: hypothetical protein JXA14_06825 [Anaerolineae bacterium]|nr:hypothetical protein [Anaerolineae bacterium]
MPERAWFIPGRPGPPGAPLARYRPVQPVRAARVYVQQLTQPGDLVVDLFCQGPTVVRETTALGRRALGFSVNPLLLVVARLGLSRPNADAVNATEFTAAAVNSAFTHLADTLKGDTPLHQHILSLYRSACPTCGAAGTAEWFAWDRDGNFPFKKTVRCPNCEGVQEGTPDEEDDAAAHRVQPRGLAYYYALDRVAPPGHQARERAAELVELYTPRNLSALMDITMRLESLETEKEVKLALTAVLLDCFDACSSLDPPDEERPRPRTLRVPSLYLERNVWLCFEDGLAHLLAEPSPLTPPPGGEGSYPVRQITDVAALVSGAAEGYALVSYAARDVRKIIEPGSAALIIVDPPQPDAVFWALSALWAGWLWESPAAQRLRPFLRRRRFDWEWHWRVLQAALQAAGPLLAPGGHLVTLFSERDEEVLTSVCLAADSAGYTLEGWGYSPEAGHRLVWHWQAEHPEHTPPELERLEQNVASAAEEAMVHTLRERGEPTIWPLLHASAHAELVRRGLPSHAAAIPKSSSPALAFIADAVRRAFEAAPLNQVAEREETEKPLWWLANAPQTADTLADQVESQVWELLIQQRTWDKEDLINATYAHLFGPLTPDLALVLVCIESYSVQVDETLHLRAEDDPLQRSAEVKTLRKELTELGKRLGFRVKRGRGWDVRWLEEGKEAYVFGVSSTASLAQHLLTKRAADEDAQRCLVLPGGRSHLANFKLQRDPRLANIVVIEEWQFIKFRLLRRLVVEEALDRHALKTVLGLDPIAEQEAAQIPLF